MSGSAGCGEGLPVRYVKGHMIVERKKEKQRKREGSILCAFRGAGVGVMMGNVRKGESNDK